MADDEPMIGTMQRRSMTGDLVDALKDRIRSGALRPGERLPTERALVADLRVSRTVVREAVARLAAEGLVEPRQGSGVFITETHEPFQIASRELADVADIARLLELRLAVETEMAGLAAERRDDAMARELHERIATLDRLIASGEDAVEADGALHLTIARATGNQYFVRFLEFLGARLVPPRSLVIGEQSPEARPRYLAQIQSEHRQIVDAIIMRDVDAARDAARRHLLGSLERHRRLV